MPALLKDCLNSFHRVGIATLCYSTLWQHMECKSHWSNGQRNYDRVHTENAKHRHSSGSNNRSCCFEQYGNAVLRGRIVCEAPKTASFFDA